jgi:hypothetical protein
VKNSTSDLLVRNCDEFIFYDDLVRKPAARKPARKKPRRKASAKHTPKDKSQEGIDSVLNTAQALYAERGDGEKLWGSMVKQALKRRQPEFNESYYGFTSFNKLLEEARDRGTLELELDEKSGGYIISGLD